MYRVALRHLHDIDLKGCLQGERVANSNFTRA
jgi:hypothetical protein